MNSQKIHLYNSKVGKIKWFARRFGISQLVMKPIRTFFAPVIILLLNKNEFLFGEYRLKMIYHPYNTTWVNERCVEVPIISKLLGEQSKKGTNILEIGNVISHYYPKNWDVLDKFEKNEGVINQDIIDFKPEKKYDLIVSISTFEHIGYDDDSTHQSANKIINCFNNVRKNCLAKNGSIILTAPIGYNPDMDRLINENAFGFKEMRFMKKFKKQQWKEVSKEEAMKSSYGRPFPYANAIMVGFYSDYLKR